MTLVERPNPLPLEHNRTGLDFRAILPRPKVRGAVIDAHCHLLAARHAPVWFECADHFGIDYFWTMGQLEEAAALARDWGHRLHFIAVPKWQDMGENWLDEWLRRIEGFYNLGSRIVKFHMAPGTMANRNWDLRQPPFQRLIREGYDRGMMFMSHIGDPEIWYRGKYADTAKFGTRDEHYKMWAEAMETVRDRTWIGAHLGGNPEDLGRLQSLLDRFPKLHLDISATRWMVREVSARRDEMREFVIRNADRLLFGSDQVSMDTRDFDFLASRFWCHRKLWETAYVGESPIVDPDLPPESQPRMQGLALPDDVLQKLYHDNAARLMKSVGIELDKS